MSTSNLVFLEQLADGLFKKIIVIFLNWVANIESLKFLKILSKKMVVSAENLIFSVTWRPDRHSKLVVTCLLETIDDVGSNNFWPISAQYSRKSIVRNVRKTRKSHVDFGHPLRKIALTYRPLPRSGLNSQDTLIGTSSTRFWSQLKNFSSDPPTLKVLNLVHLCSIFFELSQKTSRGGSYKVILWVWARSGQRSRS